jgi:hypothetical protein
MLVNGLDVHGLQEPGKACLSPGGVSPDLRDHHAGTPQLKTFPLGHP